MKRITEQEEARIRSFEAALRIKIGKEFAAEIVALKAELAELEADKETIRQKVLVALEAAKDLEAENKRLKDKLLHLYAYDIERDSE